MSATYEAVAACAAAILAGAVLQAEGVSAGRGAVIDWRTIRCGEPLLEGGDAFDVAYLFAAIVGEDAALRVACPGEEPMPQITAFAPSANGGRRRAFAVSGFRVVVEPHEDDDAQAAFTARLADVARNAT